MPTQPHGPLEALEHAVQLDLPALEFGDNRLELLERRLEAQLLDRPFALSHRPESPIWSR